MRENAALYYTSKESLHATDADILGFGFRIDETYVKVRGGWRHRFLHRRQPRKRGRFPSDRKARL
jgi:hypothetical protein